MEAWLRANQEPRPPALRANTLRTTRQELRELLAPLCPDLREHPLAPESLVLAGAHPPVARLPGFQEGLWQMQDPGATALVHLMDVRPGQRVLDLCAGAGGKTGHLAACMQNQGELVAVEPSPGRVGGAQGEPGPPGGNQRPGVAGRWHRPAQLPGAL